MKQSQMLKLICGKNSVFDAIDQRFDLEVIYTMHKSKLPPTNTKIEVVDKSFLDKMTSDNHQGFVAIFRGFNYEPLDVILQDKPAHVLMLDHIIDPGNLGAILRTANAFGVKHIILPSDRAASVNSTVIKVASGGINGLKIIKVKSLSATITWLKKQQFWIYASALDQGAQALKHTSFNDPTCLVVGNEEKGVSSTILKMADQLVFIQMQGTVQSLNVSVATGILLSHLIKE